MAYFARAYYPADGGGDSSFQVPFQYIQQDHVKVFTKDVSAEAFITELVEGVSYEWTSASSISLLTPRDASTDLLLQRVTPQSEPLVTFQSSVIQSAKLNLSTVQLLYLTQEAADAALANVSLVTERTIRSALGETFNTLPSKVGNSGKVLGLDGAGQPIWLTQGGADAALRTDLASPTGGALVAYLRPATLATVRTTLDKLSDIVSVKDFGATGSPSGNDTTAIQRADEWATANNKVLFFPEGTYVITPNTIFRQGASWRGAGKRSSTITVPAGVVFTNLGFMIACSQKSKFFTEHLCFDMSPGVYPPGTGNPGNIYRAHNFQGCTDYGVTDCWFKGGGAQRILLDADGGATGWFSFNEFDSDPSPAYNQACNISSAFELPRGYEFSDNIMRGSGMLANGQDHIVRRNRASNIGFGSGYAFGPDPGCRNMTVEHNESTGNFGLDINNVHPSGIEIWAPFSRVNFNVCSYNAGSGIGGGGFGMSGRGNVCFNNGQESDHGCGIEMVSIIYAGDVYSNTVGAWTENYLFDTQTPPTQRYGYAEYIVGGPSMAQIDLHGNKTYGNANENYRFTPGSRSFSATSLTFSSPSTVPSLAQGGTYDELIPVPGARRGDIVAVSHDADMRGWMWVGNCDADNNVVVHVQRTATGTATPPAGSWQGRVLKGANASGY